MFGYNKECKKTKYEYSQLIFSSKYFYKNVTAVSKIYISRNTTQDFRNYQHIIMYIHFYTESKNYIHVNECRGEIQICSNDLMFQEYCSCSEIDSVQKLGQCCKLFFK